ncbi:hypothetical protein DMENIID0001_022350 [Sergentomyia squamirostris]
MATKSDLRLSWWQKIALKIISSGPKIEHLAVIMDGNRRFARKLQQNPVYGHKKGSTKFFRLMEIARLMGILELTVYAFSVENFKRSAKELEEFMQFTLEVLRTMVANIPDYNTSGIRLMFLGELYMVDEEMQKYFRQLMEATKDNKMFVCNIAVAYTSRMEVTRAIRLVLESEQQVLDDVNEKMVEKYLYTQGGRTVDLVIRTSGESRLSDFQLWQSDSAVLHFSLVLWPEFDMWNFMLAILQYQIAVKCRGFSEYRSHVRH